jgi:hypothetical protein
MAGPNMEGMEEFDVQRKRATQQNAAAVQGQKDALKRRFAALGNVNSGAAIKQENLAVDSGQRRLADTNEGIDAAQRAEIRRRVETDEGRKFQTSERIGGQDFVAGQADLGRKFQTGERIGSQDFARGERLSGQDFASNEAQMARDAQAAQFKAAQDIQKKQMATAGAQFERQFGFSQDQFAHEKYIDEQNLKLANKMANEKDFIEQLFAGGKSLNPRKLIGGLATTI